MISESSLTVEIIEAIKRYKSREGLNNNGFSVSAEVIDGEYHAECDFSDDQNMTILYWEGTETELVASIYDLSNHEKISDLADLMISEGWVSGLPRDYH